MKISGKHLRNKFWERYPLNKLSKVEWEALCDNCGKCCLIKLKDINTEQIHYTNIACRLLDEKSCHCKDYKHRQSLVKNCINLNPKAMNKNSKWMPSTCAYRLLHEGKTLFKWHPLISGNNQTVHSSGNSVKNKTFKENEIPVDKWENFVTNLF
jgi:uncharacterized cysteine cluster protein YcgN (CxxCxxCC family)